MRAWLPALIPQDDAISENGRIDFSKQRITPPLSFDCLKGILLQSIEDHPIKFGASREENLNGFTFNSEKHKKKKKFDIEYFCDVLASHKQSYRLAEMIPDPENSSTLKQRLYILVPAPPAPHKLELLNWTLCLFFTRLVKASYQNKDWSNPKIYAEAQYEPSTTIQTFKACSGPRWTNFGKKFAREFCARRLANFFLYMGYLVWDRPLGVSFYVQMFSIRTQPFKFLFISASS